MIEPYVVVEKVRCVGLQMAQVVFGSGEGACVFADCMECDLSIIARFHENKDVDAYIDARAVELFQAHGWSIKPTLCPSCSKIIESV